MPTTFNAEERANAMRLMRAYRIPDAAIAEIWGLSRQQVHKILGANPREAPPAKINGASAQERLPTELRAWRTRRGLKQGPAAALLGIPRGASTISDYEGRRAGCGHPETLLRLMEMLDKYEPPST